MSALPLKGMPWVVVRQHRAVLILAAWALVLSTALAVGLRIWYEATPPDGEAGFLYARRSLRGALAVIVEYAALGAMLFPLLVAAVVAGPFVARELESGTYKLAWSQSVTPLRWFTVKVATAAVTVTVLTTALVGVFRLAWDPVSRNSYLNWSSRHVFLALGPTALAYGLLAVAIGMLTGLLVRRTLAAMSVAGLATGAVLMLMSARWGTLWTTRSGSRQDPDQFPMTADWFFTDTGLLTASGERLAGDTCLVLDRDGCLDRYEIVGRWYDYHPPSHLWPLQLVETGIVLAVAAAAAWAAFRILRKRHG
jgi:hypothetical protein